MTRVVSLSSFSYISNLCIQHSTFSRHPSVKWAQRSDKLFITIELPDAQDVKLKLEPEGKIFFSATRGADKIPYEAELELLDKVNTDVSSLFIASILIFCMHNLSNIKCIIITLAGEQGHYWLKKYPLPCEEGRE